MTVESLLRNYFDEIVEEIEGGSFGSKYRCRRGKNMYFVKSRGIEEGWMTWGLRKEYNLCNALDLGGMQPTAYMIIEDEGFLAVVFDYVDSQKTSKIYEDKKYYQTFLKQVTEFLSKVQRIDWNDNPTLQSLCNESHLVDGQLISCREYMFNDRLEGGVFFSNEDYDNYKHILERARNFARSKYRPERECLVHGDLQNSQNLLCNENGLDVVVDWEISGFFDYLYDIAAVESKFIDRPADYWNNMNASNVRESFRNEFNVDEVEGKIIDAYKIWNHYLELEVYNAHNFDLTGSRTQETEVWFIKNRLDELQSSI